MEESLFEDNTDEYINQEELKKEIHSIEEDMRKQERIKANQEAEWEKESQIAEQIEADENENNNNIEYSSSYDDACAELKKLKPEYQEKTCILSKIEQSERFYDKYCLPGKAAYSNIIHKQDKNVKDKLDKKKDAIRIADLIVMDKVKTVGIFGEWGTGKSTFLELIKKELHKKNNIRVVDLKATEYSDRDKIWTYFCAEMDKAKIEEKNEKFWHIVKSYVIPIVGLPLLYLGFYKAVLLVFEYFNMLEVMALLCGIKAENCKSFTDGMFVLVGIVFIFKNIIPILENAFDLYGFWNAHFNKYKINYKEKFGYKLVVKNHIDEILNSMQEYHFVFCVDELDRCNNTAVMEFLEAIQLIDDCERIHIIYAVDEEVVFEAIKQAGFKNPQNYLKKYVDQRIYLDSINSMNDYTKNIAKEYDFFDEEIEKIQWALNLLSVNISIREYYHILNTLSDLRKKWIDGEVKEELALKTETNKSALNWYNFLPIAVFYLEGNIWIKKIERSFKNYYDLYVKVDDRIKASNKDEDFKDCPYYIKNMYLIDIINSVRFLDKTKPLFYMNEKATGSNIKNFPE